MCLEKFKYEIKIEGLSVCKKNPKTLHVSLKSRVKQVYVLSFKEQVDIHGRRTAVLRALPLYLCEDDSKFLRMWDVSQNIVILFYFHYCNN